MLSVAGIVFASLVGFVASSSSYTYCYNCTECANETITTTYAACYGYRGCDSATITSSHTLAYGELACYNAEIDSSTTYLYGHYGGYSANIATGVLYGYGYQAARIADIEPYSSSLKIYFYGYYAGYASDVSCYSGDSCYIYCGSGHGCYEVDYYCYSGATCYYDCSGDDVCPTTYSGVESDLTYVTSIGKNSKESSSKVMNFVSIIDELTDEEISEYKMENRLKKDSSLKKLEQDTVDDTNSQVAMAYDEEFDLFSNEKRNNNNEETVNYINGIYNLENKMFTQYKYASGDDKDLSFLDLNINALSSISLTDYGVGLIIDICIAAVFYKIYNYCQASKQYQEI